MHPFEKLTKEELKNLIDKTPESNDIMVFIGQAIYTKKNNKTLVLANVDNFTLYEQIKVKVRNNG